VEVVPYVPALRRLPRPVLTPADIPPLAPELADASAVFNPGALLVDGRVRLMLRVQTRGRETRLVMADSGDGLSFDLADSVLTLRGLEQLAEGVHHVYDPRLTALEGSYYAMLALDLDERCALGLARSADLEDWDFLGLVSEDDNRNGVLFPERVGGRYLRLDRPNRVRREGAMAGGDAIQLSESEDLLRWTPVDEIAAGRPRLWDELIGPGPPPLKTRAGWLLVYHGIATRAVGGGLYQAGAMLLDLENPARVLARTRNNILEPRERWELTGQVPGVVFPSGLVALDVDGAGFAADDSRVLLYYGAADTCVGLATSTVSALRDACRED
jgi:beta-1,4-mannooligosaccharide/beta-1,4-mannosyl-N-acetylglucosamine phosphorylase